MATPTITLINAGGLTDGVLGTNGDADAVTGWFDFDTLETDIKVEGTYSITGTGRANNEDMYYDAGSAPVTAVGKVFRWWVNTVNIPYMGTLAGANPYELLFYDGTTTTRKAMLGSDTYEGGWAYVFQDMDLVTTGNGWSASPTLANIRRWGLTTGHDTNAKNVNNVWADVMRYMDGYSFNASASSSGDPVTMSDLFTADMGTNAYGIVQRSRGIYFCTGTIQIGNGATTTYFSCNGQVLQFIATIGQMQISAGLYEISAVGSGTNCSITGSVIRGAGTGAATKIYFDFSDTSSTVTFTNNLIVDGGTIQFASGQTATGNTFDNCGQITHGGADMTGCVIKNYEGTSDTAGLVYNVNADPDGEMDSMVFTKGTSSTHAIEFGSTTPSEVTLRDIIFNGYNATGGNTDSALYVSDTNTGNSYTINLVGCSGNITYKSAGASVTLVIDPVTTSVTVKDATALTNIENARVLLLVADGANFPYQASVTIVQASGTATVTHNAHGLTTGNKVYISGATPDAYNRVKTITVTGANTYTFSIDSGTTSPATGTIISTMVIIDGSTNASGYISDTRSFGSNQLVTGRARKSSGTPLYKTSAITGTINSTAGVDFTTLLIKDE